MTLDKLATTGTTMIIISVTIPLIILHFKLTILILTAILTTFIIQPLIQIIHVTNKFRTTFVRNTVILSILLFIIIFSKLCYIQDVKSLQNNNSVSASSFHHYHFLYRCNDKI